MLSRYYIHHGESAAEFDTLARTAKHLMNWVMRELGPVLTALPVGPSHPGQTAGPAFDLTYRASFLLPHQDAAWKIINERLDALEEACAALAQPAGLAALTKVLLAVSEDSAGRTVDGGAAIRAEADAALDYVDQIGLRLEGPSWEEVPGVPRAALPPETLARMADTWLTFCAGPLPAPRRLGAFVDAVTA